MAFDNSYTAFSGHIIFSNYCFTPSSMSDLERKEKLTHSKLTEPKLLYNVCHYVSTNKKSHLLMWVFVALGVIYSLKPGILTHLKFPMRSDGDNHTYLLVKTTESLLSTDPPREHQAHWCFYHFCWASFNFPLSCFLSYLHLSLQTLTAVTL